MKSIYSLYRSVLFMEESYSLLSTQVAYSVEFMFDDTDTGSSDFAFFTYISSDIGIQIRKALN
jgi:hypothetical protein